MKKIAYSLLLLGAQLAQASTPSSHPFTGFYATGEVGVTSAKFGVIPYSYIEPFDFNFPGDFDMYGTSPSGLVGLGYLYQFNHRFVLGAEATAGYTRADAGYRPEFHEVVAGANVLAQVSTHLESTLTNDFSLLFKLGILCGQNTLFFAAVGPRWGNIETSAETNLSLTIPPQQFDAHATDTVSGYQLGVTAGVGIQQILTEHFHLKLEYMYTDYGNIDAPTAPANISIDGVPSGTFFNNAPEIDASTNTVMLGFSYHW